jgi:2,4-dienoyl-CoA reductase-like NADH-dependent reductase (Old Yellow Enzyme family)
VTGIVQLKRLGDVAAFARHCEAVGVALPIDEVIDPHGPLAASLEVTDGSAGTRTVGNRFTALPMEGWDGTTDGEPTDLVRRRWRRLGRSGAKLIWGGEAVAVEPDGRANPNQLVISARTVDQLAALRGELVAAHRDAHGRTDDLLVGLQLTHSGRWSRPLGTPAPRTVLRHPVLDARVGAGAESVFDDDELDRLVDRYVGAATIAADAGFDFVDVKHCHGYLLHELLAGRDRPGRFGGSVGERLAFLSKVVEGVRAARPGLAVGVRLSAFDFVPFEPGPDGRGRPVPDAGGWTPFGATTDGLGIDLTEVHEAMARFRELGIGMVCVTGGSPYYNPHIQRPAYFPPSDGYHPPDDPLLDVVRLIDVAAELAHEHRDLAVVGSGYSYLQDFVGYVGQAVVRRGDAASVGLGRMMLSYPEMPADLLAGRPLNRRQVCRTLSDCTTAPRNGLVSGCYPFDEFYKERPERVELAAAKRTARKQLRPD